MAKTSVAVAVLLLLAVQQTAVRADIRCSDVINDLSPCLSFLQGDEERPSGACCRGVTTLYAAADTKEERQATCECLKAAYGQVRADLSAAQELPGDCGISLSYTITPDIDCTQIE